MIYNNIIITIIQKLYSSNCNSLSHNGGSQIMNRILKHLYICNSNKQINENRTDNQTSHVLDFGTESNTISSSFNSAIIPCAFCDSNGT